MRKSLPWHLKLSWQCVKKGKLRFFRSKMFSKCFHGYIEEYSKAHETGLFCVVGTTIHEYTFSMFWKHFIAYSNTKKLWNAMKNGQFEPENDHYPWNNVKIAWYQAYTRNPPPNLQTMAWRYLLKIVIFWQKQTKMSQKQPKNDWFLLIFDVFTIKNSVKCFQNVFTGS